MATLILIFVLVRLVLGVVARTVSEPDDEPRAHRGSMPTSVSIALLVWAIVPLKCLQWFGEVLRGEWATLPWLLAGLTALFPWALARRVLIPAGLCRAAYMVTRLSNWVWRGDGPGGATLAAAWALAHRKKTPPQTVAWVTAKRDANRPLRGGGILASALLADLRDDRDGMLELTRSVLLLADDPRHRAARRLAAQWLAAHAAAQGDWVEVAAVTRRVRGLSGAARLLARIAAAHLHGVSGARARAQLWATWLLAPRRVQTWGWVRAALRAEPSGEVPSNGAPDATRADSEDVPPTPEPSAAHPVAGAPSDTDSAGAVDPTTVALVG
ncbi:MAG: hypothetical protein AAF721_39120, partial [Myxococcota bacterium]